MQSRFIHAKQFGQHFLKSDETALQIVEALQPLEIADDILEIGPGFGKLTKYLLRLKNKNIFVSEIDERIIAYAKKELHIPHEKIIAGDFIKADLHTYFPGNFFIIGNFPYNISSQILFKMLEYKSQVPLLVGMFQKEMARRVTAVSGNKEYGVITVLVQAFYDTQYLFELQPDAFDPPPKVESAVIRITRKKESLQCNEKLFRQIVKAGFNQRRKKLSNALAIIPGAKEILLQLNFADKRAEQLSVADFIQLTAAMENVHE